MDMIKTEPFGGKIIFIQISTNLISYSTDPGKIETLLLMQELRYLRLLKCFYIFISNILYQTLDISQIARQARATTVVRKGQKGFSCGFIGKKSKYYNINIIIVNSLLNPPPHFINFLHKLIKLFVC